MDEQLKATPVASGRVKGLLMSAANPPESEPLLVIFNQWRSGSHFIISQYLAKMILTEDKYSGVLFLDRLASAGESDNHLNKQERQNMKHFGDFQFGKLYASALEKIVEKHKLSSHWVLGGSSAGAAGALACADGMTKAQRKKVKTVVLVEPAGLKKQGFGKKNFGALPIALGKHLVAYRHRVQRGWWTPMDKEQYFKRKGKMLEYRFKWSVNDYALQNLFQNMADPNFPPIVLILSENSHLHTAKERADLQRLIVSPHRYIAINGNHDKICQPPSLSKLYSEAY